MIESDASLPKRSGHRGLRIFAFILGALALIAILGALFQFFLRYDYAIDSQGAIWRVDRLTQQSCRVIHAVVHCGPLSSSKSVSKSFSLSPSISTSLTGRRTK
jgi:hypothetical protein